MYWRRVDCIYLMNNQKKTKKTAIVAEKMRVSP
jgi:Mn-dependent DtxR family transcriptional regulator